MPFRGACLRGAGCTEQVEVISNKTGGPLCWGLKESLLAGVGKRWNAWSVLGCAFCVWPGSSPGLSFQALLLGLPRRRGESFSGRGWLSRSPASRGSHSECGLSGPTAVIGGVWPAGSREAMGHSAFAVPRIAARVSCFGSVPCGALVGLSVSSSRPEGPGLRLCLSVPLQMLSLLEPLFEARTLTSSRNSGEPLGGFLGCSLGRSLWPQRGA